MTASGGRWTRSRRCRSSRRCTRPAIRRGRSGCGATRRMPDLAGPLRLSRPADRGLRVLAIGAHADDIEIGAGGTILRLISEGLVGEVRWVVLSADGERDAEARAGAAAFTSEVANVEVILEQFRDGFFPYLGPVVKEFFEEHKASFEPDLILTHRRDDLHQDHRLVGE